MSKRPRRSWTTEEKQAIAAEIRRRTEAGEPLSRVAESLGIYQTTARLWLERFSLRTLKPVQIVETSPVPTSTAGPISIATPDGFLLDGLDLEGAIRIWERLR